VTAGLAVSGTVGIVGYLDLDHRDAGSTVVVADDGSAVATASTSTPSTSLKSPSVTGSHRVDRAHGLPAASGARAATSVPVPPATPDVTIVPAAPGRTRNHATTRGSAG
jgi:hypothetical protein